MTEKMELLESSLLCLLIPQPLHQIRKMVRQSAEEKYGEAGIPARELVVKVLPFSGMPGSSLPQKLIPFFMPVGRCTVEVWRKYGSL